MGRKKAVIFDYGGVISTAQVPEEIEAMLGLLKVEANRFHHWYYYYRPLYDRGIPGEEYWQKVLAACRVDYNRELVAKLIKHDIRSWTQLNPAVLDWVAQLKQTGYKVGIISNMPPDILAYMQENFRWLKEDLFDSLIFSCQRKVCKPDPEIYRVSLQEIGLEATECLFIDDTEENIEAARKLGYSVFHYRQPADLEVLQKSLLPLV